MSVPEITVDELDTRLAAGATLIDVRQPEEYVAGHVAEARLIPLEFQREQEVDANNVAGGTMAWIDSGRDVVTGAT